MIKELFRKMTIAQIFSALSGTVCMLVDSIIVGRLLGVDCMSAYGLALPLLTLLIALGTMICCGVQVVCAKALGFGNLDDASACYSTSIVISLAMAVIGALLIFTACDPICILLGAGKANHTVFVETGEFLKLSDFLDRETSLLISDTEFKIDEEIDLFKRAFDFLAERMGQDTFKKFNLDKGCFEGAFSNASYEAILVGVAENLETLRNIDFRRMVEGIYSQEKFLRFASRGVKVVSRFQGLNEFSREYFSNAD